jgi:hypothetical protein
MSKFIRSPVFIVVGVIMLCGFLLAAPALRFRYIQRPYWESQIRQHQNPFELQAWATSLLAIYSKSNVADLTILTVTNTPPSGFPVTVNPDIALCNDTISGGGDYVQLLWGSPFFGRFGIRIGSTNYVCGLPDKWKSGIYFFSGP